MIAKTSEPLEQGAPLDQGRGFRAFVFKELTQYYKQAGLAAAGLCVILAFEVAVNVPSETPIDQIYSTITILMWNDATPSFLAAAPVMGFLIALVQSVSDQRRDLSAFILHRPLTRSAIFYASAVAGLIFYCAALLLPLLLMMLWTLPHLSSVSGAESKGLPTAFLSICCGFIFYFAGWLAALPTARFWASRLLPIPAAVGIFALSLNSYHDGTFATIFLVLAAALLFSAQSVFVSRGYYEQQTFLGRLCLGLIFSLGLAAIILALCVLGTSFASFNVSGSNTSSGVAGGPAFPEYRYAISQSGQVVALRYSQSDRIASVQSLTGSPVRHLAGESAFTDSDLLPTTQIGEDGIADMNIFSRSINREVINLSTGFPPNRCYYMRGARRIVEYSRNTGKEIGALTPAGFQPGAVSGVGAFPSRLDKVVESQQQTYLLFFPHALYYLNLNTNAVRQIKLPKSDYPLVSSQIISSGSQSESQGIYFLLSSSKNFIIIDNAGRMLSSLPRAFPLTTYQMVKIVIAPSHRIFIWYRMGSDTTTDQVWEYDMEGRFIRRQFLPRLPWKMIGLWQTPSVKPSPTLSLIAFVLPASIIAYIQCLQFLSPGVDQLPLAFSLPLFWQLAALLSVLSGGIAYLIARRCAYTRYGTWAWTIGAFFLGLPGMLLMLALREWPAQEICPDCRKKRVVTRELCEHCGAPWAAISRDGTEIFEGTSS